MLLEAGADPLIEDNRGKNAIDHARSFELRKLFSGLPLFSSSFFLD
jgi:hypothetical protein